MPLRQDGRITVDGPSSHKKRRISTATSSGRRIMQRSLPDGFVDSSAITDDEGNNFGDRSTSDAQREVDIAHHQEHPAIAAPAQGTDSDVTDVVMQDIPVFDQVEQVEMRTIIPANGFAVRVQGKPTELEVLAASSITFQATAQLESEIVLFTFGGYHTSAALAAPNLAASTQQPAHHLPDVKVPVTPDMRANAGLIGRFPREIREKIFSLLFVVDAPIALGYDMHRMNLSASFLRTCKLVQAEGCSMLYARNHFILNRRMVRLGNVWTSEHEWQEVGFKLVEQWLRNMGPSNVGWLRSISIKMQDAPAGLNPHLTSSEARAYHNDPYLARALVQLGQHGKLAFLELDFEGRSRIDDNAKCATFLGILTNVKTDQLLIIGDKSAQRKHTGAVSAKCKAHMIRRQPLWATKFPTLRKSTGRPISYNTVLD